jgi:hypothetical protein
VSSKMSPKPGNMGVCGSTNCPTPPPQLKLYQAFIFVTPILFTLVLLLLCCCLYLRRRQRIRDTTQIRAQLFTRGLFSAHLEQGLNKSLRDGLPVLVYNEEFATSRDDTLCAVCLADYQNNEKLQQLPICSHAFHKECIDQWLVNHSTCPICRVSLLQSGKVVPMNSPAQTPAALEMCSRLPLTEHDDVRSGAYHDPIVGSNQDDGFALNVLPEDDGASGSSTANVLLREETSHLSHPSMEEHVQVIGDDEHIIQIGH